MQKTGGDWRNDSVATSCKRHIMLRPLDNVIAFVEKKRFRVGLERGFKEFAWDWQDWCFASIQILQRNDYS